MRGRKGAIWIGVLGVLMIAAGIRMHMRNDVHSGTHMDTQQPWVVTGPYVGLVGLLFVVSAWFMWKRRTE